MLDNQLSHDWDSIHSNQLFKEKIKSHLKNIYIYATFSGSLILLRKVLQDISHNLKPQQKWIFSVFKCSAAANKIT